MFITTFYAPLTPLQYFTDTLSYTWR